MTDDLELGGNIVLSGFSEIDKGSMIIVKKLVGSSAKKFSESCKDFQELKITVKPIHHKESEPAKKFEIRVNLTAGGNNYTSDVTDNNLFVVLDKALKKVEHNLQK